MNTWKMENDRGTVDKKGRGNRFMSNSASKIKHVDAQ